MSKQVTNTSNSPFASLITRGITLLTNTINQDEDKALTPKGANDLEIEQYSYGIRPFSPSINYKLHAKTLGSDGIDYKAILPSGPNTFDEDGNLVGVKDPVYIENKPYWTLFGVSSDYGYPVYTDCTWYVRPDGNDDLAKELLATNPFASQNIPEKAFKTVSVAHNFFASNYYLTKQGRFILQLGLEGTYIEPEETVLYPVSVISGSQLSRDTVTGITVPRTVIVGNLTNKNRYIISVTPNPDTRASHILTFYTSIRGISCISTQETRLWGYAFSDECYNVSFQANAPNIVGLMSGNPYIIGQCSIVSTYSAPVSLLNSPNQGLPRLGEIYTTDGFPTNISISTTNKPSRGTIELSRNSLLTFATSGLTFSGSHTGPKYYVDSFCLLDTAGQLAKIPGSTSGIVIKDFGIAR